MVRQCAVFAALLGACWLALGVPARADDASEARVWFERGIAASRSGDFAEAVEAFKHSSELAERPSVLQNLSVALEHLGRYREALDAVERALTLQAKTAPRERAKLESLRAELLGKVAELRFEVSPSEAVVELDGRLLEAREARCDPGEHQLRVSASGHQTATRVLTLAMGARRVERIMLDAQAATEPVARAPFVQPATSAAAVHDRSRLRWGLVSLGAGVALAGAAAGLQLHAASQESHWRDQCPEGDTSAECSRENLKPEQRSIDRLDYTSFALFGLAGASAVLGTTLLWLHGREQRHPVSVSLSPRHVQLSVRF
jgi:tetratricopeptide (TPR) repeat protein